MWSVAHQKGRAHLRKRARENIWLMAENPERYRERGLSTVYGTSLRNIIGMPMRYVSLHVDTLESRVSHDLSHRNVWDSNKGRSEVSDLRAIGTIYCMAELDRFQMISH